MMEGVFYAIFIKYEDLITLLYFNLFIILLGVYLIIIYHYSYSLPECLLRAERVDRIIIIIIIIYKLLLLQLNQRYCFLLFFYLLFFFNVLIFYLRSCGVSNCA